MQLNDKAKKAISLSTKILTCVLVVFTVFMMIFTIISVTTLDRNDRSIFGIKFYIVQTDSMSLSDKNADLDVHFNAGDIVLIKDVEDPLKLEKGDIISFLSTNEDSFGETITHMIDSVQKTSDGRVIGYRTYGTNKGTLDKEMVEPEYIIGRYAGKLPLVGHFFAFLRSTPGYIVCILVPFLLLILYNLANVVRLYRKYRQEQNAVIEAERAEIAEERKRNEEMLQQLMELQAKLQKSDEKQAEEKKE